MSYALIFLHEWQDLQFKVDSERQIFEKLFVTILFSLRVFARNLLSNIFSYFRFLRDVWAEDLTTSFLSNKQTYYLLANGDFIKFYFSFFLTNSTCLQSYQFHVSSGFPLLWMILGFSFFYGFFWVYDPLNNILFFVLKFFEWDNITSN